MEYLNTVLEEGGQADVIYAIGHIEKEIGMTKISEEKGEYYLGEVPPFIQKFVFPMIAILGKMFGIVKAKPKTT